MNVPPAPSAGPRRGRHVSRRLSARASGGSGEVKGSAPERSGGDDRLRQLDTAGPPHPHDMCHPHHVSSLRVVSAPSQERARAGTEPPSDRAAGRALGGRCFGVHPFAPKILRISAVTPGRPRPYRGTTAHADPAPDFPSSSWPSDERSLRTADALPLPARPGREPRSEEESWVSAPPAPQAPDAVA